MNYAPLYAFAAAIGRPGKPFMAVPAKKNSLPERRNRTVMRSIQPTPLHKVDIFYTIRLESLAKKYPYPVPALLGDLFIGLRPGF